MIGPGKLALAAAGLLLALQVQTGPELDAPFRVMADGEPIDVDVGHAAPFFADFDNDGLKDLLVGQFGDGKLRIYRNIGTRSEPKFSDFFCFQAAGADGTVPAS